MGESMETKNAELESESARQSVNETDGSVIEGKSESGRN